MKSRKCRLISIILLLLFANRPCWTTQSCLAPLPRFLHLFSVKSLSSSVHLVLVFLGVSFSGIIFQLFTYIVHIVFCIGNICLVKIRSLQVYFVILFNVYIAIYFTVWNSNTSEIRYWVSVIMQKTFTLHKKYAGLKLFLSKIPFVKILMP